MKKYSLELPSPREQLSIMYGLIIGEVHKTEKAVQFPIKIGDNQLTASFFGMENGRLCFGLFLGEQKYSRKTLGIDADGNIYEDKIGVLPESDKTDHEPDFSSITDTEIALKVIGRLVEELKIQPAQ